jgi:molybdopterin converting factor small subunit
MDDNKIEVTIKLFAYYRDGKFDTKTEKYPVGTTIQQVMDSIGLDLLNDPLGILLVNGCHAKPSDTLHNNDTISIFPMLGGG